jgi:Dolichyl-phosphate-mannose-protein mannosyltransferase
VPDWAIALAVALVARLSVLVVGYVVVANRRVGGAHWSFVARLTREWAFKDGGSFIAIARTGYSRPNGAAFFPLYPLALRATALLTGGDYPLAGVLLSLACYAVAMVLLYRLTAAEFDSRTAALAVAFISVFPTALSFGLVYSESLFLALTLAVFAFARRGRWPAAGAAGMLAVATRSSGLVLLPALVLLYGGQQGWSWRSVSLRYPRDLRLGWLLLVPVGLLAYMGYLWRRLGDPLAFSVAERVHWGRTLDWPTADAVRGYRAAVTGVQALYHHKGGIEPYLAASTAGHGALLRLLAFATLVLAVAGVVVCWRRLPWGYTVLAGASVLVPLLFPTRLHPLYSFPRFTLVIFPLFMALGVVLRKRPVLAWVLIAVSFVGMLWLTRLFALDLPAI